jgi:hypothetical protein
MVPVARGSAPGNGMGANLPQLITAFKPAAALCVLMLASLMAVSARADDDPPQPLFDCAGAAPHASISLATHGDQDSGWAGAQITVRFGNGRQFIYPQDAATGRHAFFFSHANGRDGGYHVHVRFDHNGQQFRLWSDYFAPDPNDPDDAGGGGAGLEVLSHKGKWIAALQCDGAPEEYLGYMREVVDCDKETPFGTGSCQDAPGEGDLDRNRR